MAPSRRTEAQKAAEKITRQNTKQRRAEEAKRAEEEAKRAEEEAKRAEEEAKAAAEAEAKYRRRREQKNASERKCRQQKKQAANAVSDENDPIATPDGTSFSFASNPRDATSERKPSAAELLSQNLKLANDIIQKNLDSTNKIIVEEAKKDREHESAIMEKRIQLATLEKSGSERVRKGLSDTTRNILGDIVVVDDDNNVEKDDAFAFTETTRRNIKKREDEELKVAEEEAEVAAETEVM